MGPKFRLRTASMTALRSAPIDGGGLKSLRPCFGGRAHGCSRRMVAAHAHVPNHAPSPAPARLLRFQSGRAGRTGRRAEKTLSDAPPTVEHGRLGAVMPPAGASSPAGPAFPLVRERRAFLWNHDFHDIHLFDQDPVQHQVDLEHVDRLLPEDAEEAAVRALVDNGADFILAHAVGLR